MAELSIEQKRKGRLVLMIVLLMIIGFFSVNLTLWFVAISLTNGDKSHGMDRRYLEETSVKNYAELEKKSQLLGWSVSSDVKFPENREKPATWILTLKDADKKHLSKATIKVDAFQNASSADVQVLEMKEVSPGVYQQQLKIRRPGKWRFWIKATKDKQVYYCDHQQYIRLPKEKK